MSDQPNNFADDEIDLRELIRTLWDGKWLIALITLLSSAVAVGYALLATDIYKSEALVQPREAASSGGLGTLTAQFGGLANLAGISVGGGGNSAVAIATLKSRTVVEAFIREKNLLPKLYEQGWDEATGKWKATGSKTIPTIWQAYGYFTSEIFKVSENKRAGLVTVSVEWKDPEEAQQWVTELVARTNAHLRAEAIREGERNLAYLEQQSRSIGQVELQQALFKLVEEEQKKLMVAKGGEEFALKTIDAATAPTKHDRPKRTLIAILGFMLGGFIGVLWALIRKVWQRDR